MKIGEAGAAEVDAAKHIEAYAEGIRLAGCEPLVREGVPDLGVIQWLRDTRPDICFNVCEGFGGESREAHHERQRVLLHRPPRKTLNKRSCTR